MDQLTEQFYRDVLPPTGDYFTAILPKNSKKLTQGKQATLEEFLSTVALVSQSGHNAYYATGSFNGERTKEQVQYKQCYYVDIDTGREKDAYPTPSSALMKLLALTKADVLPKASYIVSTGHGVHLYWVLDEPIPAEQWQQGANNLKQICIDNEFHADHAITGDAARIMRCPSSINVKNPTLPVDCTIMQSTGAKYKPTLFGSAPAINYPQLLLDAVSHNDLIPKSEVVCESRGIFEKCGVLQRSLLTGGVDDSEPLWSNVLNTLYFAEDGEKFIHAVSKGHRDYSPSETDRKFNGKSASSGPTQCEIFASLQECHAICGACPHRGEVKTPLLLGRVEAEPVEVVAQVEVGTADEDIDLDIPYPYSVGPQGLRKVKGKDTDDRPEFELTLPQKFSHKLINLLRCADYTNGHLYKLILEHHEAAIEIPFLEELHDQKTWDKLLGSSGVVMSYPFNQRFREFVVAWLQNLQKNAARLSQRHFGWSDDHKAFCVGDKVYTDNKELTNHMVDAVMRDKYSVVGDIDEWVAKANKVIKDRPQSAMIIASSLAAPLIGFTGDPGCVMACHGESGTGKTTVMKIAQALWGHPVKGMMSLDDTMNSMLNSLGVMRNLPAYWDEVRSAREDDRMMQIVFRLTAGRERTRLTASIQQREVHEWQTILVTSSNISALGTIASQTKDSDAGIMRVFEFTMPPIINSLGDLKVTKCYGAAGRVYGRYLVEHGDEVQHAVEKAEESMKLSLKATEPERFRVSLLAALLVGAQLGNKVLGLEFDMNSLVTHMKEEFHGLRAVSQTHREAYAMPTLLVNYMNISTPNRLVTDKIAGRGKQSIQTLSFPKNNNPIYVQVAQDGGALVSKREFDEWVEQHVGIKGHKVREEMEKLPGVQVTQRNIGGGTSMATARVYVYKIDMPHASWGGAFDNLYQPLQQASNVTPMP